MSHLSPPTWTEQVIICWYDDEVYFLLNQTSVLWSVLLHHVHLINNPQIGIWTHSHSLSCLWTNQLFCIYSLVVYFALSGAANKYRTDGIWLDWGESMTFLSHFALETSMLAKHNLKRVSKYFHSWQDNTYNKKFVSSVRGLSVIWGIWDIQIDILYWSAPIYL